MQKPVKVNPEVVELLGKLFEKYWKKFYETHQGEFKNFLKENDLTEVKIQKLGINKNDLIKQWCAVKISYYLFCYAGLMQTHYLPNTKEARQNVEHITGPSSFSPKDPTEGRIGKLFRDIMAGTKYTVEGDLDSFKTFGDCDEIGFSIAESATAISIYHKFGTELRIYPAGKHALVGLKFKGIKKEFLIDPTFVGTEYMYPSGRIVTIPIHEKAKEYDKKDPQGKFIHVVEFEDESESGEIRAYKIKVAPKLNRMLYPETVSEIIKVDPARAKELEDAFKFVSEQPHEVFVLLRHRNRRLWNRDLREQLDADSSERKSVPEYMSALRPGYGSAALNIATDYIATFFPNYIEALPGLKSLEKDLGVEKSFKLLQNVLVPAIRDNKDLKQVLVQFLREQQKVAVR